MSKQMDDIRMEVEGMEKALSERGREGKPAEPVEAEPVVEPIEEPIVEDPVEPEPVVEDTPIEDLTADPVTEPEPVVEPKKARTNWKKRFTNYKASTDATIHDLRINLKTEMDRSGLMIKRMATMQKRVEDLESAAPVADLFTAEERDVLGDEAISTIQKATDTLVKRQTDPLKEKLKFQAEQEAKSLEARSQAEQSRAYHEFHARLADHVPNLDEINMDPEFKVWLDEPDPVAGTPRLNLFRAAERSADIGRVAGFFNEFSTRGSAKQKELDSHITPKGKSPDVAPKVQGSQKPAKNIWTLATIEQFAMDCIKGNYKGKEELRAKIEADIDAAYHEGRVR